MRFIVDAQLPPLLALWLREAGHDANHVMELGLEAADDAVIWSLCRRTEATLLTKDEDFYRPESAQR